AARRHHRREADHLLDRRGHQREPTRLAGGDRGGRGGHRVRRRLRDLRDQGDGAGSDAARPARRGRGGLGPHRAALLPARHQRAHRGAGEVGDAGRLLRRDRGGGRGQDRDRRDRPGADGGGARGAHPRPRPGGPLDRHREGLRHGVVHHGDLREGRVRHRGHGRAPDAGPQGDGGGRGGRRGDRGPVAPSGGLRQRAVVHLLPAAGRVDRCLGGRGQERRPRDRGGKVSVHGERQGGGPRRDRRLREGGGRQGHRRDPRRAHRGSGGHRDDPRVRGGPDPRGDGGGDRPHHPRASHALRGRARGDAGHPGPPDPHLIFLSPLRRGQGEGSLRRVDFELTPAQEALRLRARELADGTFRERAARWDAQEQYPWDNVKDLVRAGFMGLTIPREYAGPAASILDVLLVVEEIARVCGVTARIVVEGSLGVVGALAAYGSEAQKRRYFPWVLDGDKPAIAITEPEAGSAATDLVTRADEAPEGYALHGEKRWITGAGTS